MTGRSRLSRLIKVFCSKLLKTQTGKKYVSLYTAQVLSAVGIDVWMEDENGIAVLYNEAEFLISERWTNLYVEVEPTSE